MYFIYVYCKKKLLWSTLASTIKPLYSINGGHIKTNISCKDDNTKGLEVSTVIIGYITVNVEDHEFI